MGDTRTKTKVSDEIIEKLHTVWVSCRSTVGTVEHKRTFMRWLTDLWERGVIDDRCYSFYRRAVRREFT